MSPNQHFMTTDMVKDHEAVVDHIDHQESPKKGGFQAHPDKFGSAAKVDPKEIALVRKLDTYLMVSRSLHFQ